MLIIHEADSILNFTGCYCFSSAIILLSAVAKERGISKQSGQKNYLLHSTTMKRHVTCFVEKDGFEPRTLGTKAERYDHCATRPVEAEWTFHRHHFTSPNSLVTSELLLMCWQVTTVTSLFETVTT